MRPPTQRGTCNHVVAHFDTAVALCDGESARGSMTSRGLRRDRPERIPSWQRDRRDERVAAQRAAGAALAREFQIFALSENQCRGVL
eukprot:3168377-Alexandrium_andersonii.AAC.1